MSMKIVTLNLPNQYIDCMEILINMGFFPSRCEVVREAIRQFLHNEANLNKGLNLESFNNMKKTQMEKMLH